MRGEPATLTGSQGLRYVIIGCRGVSLVSIAVVYAPLYSVAGP